MENQIIKFRTLQMERYNQGLRHAEQSKKESVAVLTFRRQTLLASLLLCICQYASVDDFHILPAGIILYVVGVMAALEQIELINNEASFLLPWWETYNDNEIFRRQQLEEFEQKRNAALFEYHVLKGKTNVRIVPVQEGGVMKLYAIG